MHLLKKQLFVLIAILLCTLPLKAQDTASIVGTVTDATGAAVPGASVVLTDPATGKSYKTVTGTNGAYTFANVPPGPGYK